MLKLSFFVDFSNLLGSLSKVNIKIDDYEKFFAFLSNQAYQALRICAVDGCEFPPVVLNRIYWYAVGSGDTYNFAEEKTQEFFAEKFNSNKEIKSAFISDLGKKHAGMPQADLAKLATENFIADRQAWYNERRQKIKGFCDFYDMIRRQCDYITITDCGYWKMDFISKDVDEKGIDTALAVDSVTMSDTFDIAIILSGDADMIPSVNYLKRQGKYVGVMSFIKGYPPEKKGRQQSRRLSRAADFDTQIYEMDLVRAGFAHALKRGEAEL